MTPDEFNEKYKDFLEDRHYGMSISNEKVIDFLDKEFKKEIATNPEFSYSQIKTKFSYVRIYAETLDKATLYKWENDVQLILKE